jgi:hypothetical protein
VPLDTFWMDTKVHSINPAFNTYAQSAMTLQTGVKYRITVEGTHTVWNAGYTYTHNQLVMYPSAGRSGADHAYTDSEVIWGNEAATLTPTHSPLLMISVNGGASYYHPDPEGGHPNAWTANHAYSYVITGQGQKLRAAISDNPIADNNGKYRIDIDLHRSGWYVGRLTAGGTDPEVFVPYSTTGWKYKQPIPFNEPGTGGSGSYTHNTDFTKHGFDDSSWDDGHTPFGGNTGGVYPAGWTYWEIQSGIKLRRLVVVNNPVDLYAEVSVDNLAYIYWNGEMLHFFDNSNRTARKSGVLIPATKVIKGANIFAVMGWEETYDYSPNEGGSIDVELRKA